MNLSDLLLVTSSTDRQAHRTNNHADTLWYTRQWNASSSQKCDFVNIFISILLIPQLLKLCTRFHSLSSRPPYLFLSQPLSNPFTFSFFKLKEGETTCCLIYKWDREVWGIWRMRVFVTGLENWRVLFRICCKFVSLYVPYLSTHLSNAFHSVVPYMMILTRA